MMFRNPEHIARMNAQYRATAPSYIEEYRDRHDQIRQPSDPETFDEFKVRFLSREHNMTGLHAIPTMLQSRRVLGEIQSFHFWTATLSDFASPTFLTSDRSIIMTNGLNTKEAHIVMPISPRVLFIAARGRWLHDQLSRTPHTKLAKMVNEKVARQSHRYVYGTDASQRKFISKRLGLKEKSTPFG